MLNAKYPDQKGFTRDEYNAVADNYNDEESTKTG